MKIVVLITVRWYCDDDNCRLGTDVCYDENGDAYSGANTNYENVTASSRFVFAQSMQ